MMNQGGESSVGFESNAAKKYHPSDMSEHVSLTAGHHSWSSSTGPVTITWNSQGLPNAPTVNGPPSNSGYHYYTQGGVSVSGDAQSGANSTSNASTSSSLGATNVAQDYASYASYPTSAQPYMYSNAEYQNYYNYHQPSTGSSSQQVGDCQNSGAPQQSFSSFQQTSSYVAPTSYSSTYYNAGDQQTTVGNTNNSYVNQPNYWNNGGTSGSCHPHQYQYYTQSVPNSTQVTSNVTANSHHYQQYNQWPYYYYPSAPAVSCAPGTENMSATSGTPARPVQTASGGYPPPSNQPPPPGTTSWKTESGSSVSPFLQVNHNMAINSLNGPSEVAALTSQSQQMGQPPSHYQKPTESNPLPFEKREDQQMAMHSQGPNFQAPSTNQVLENFQSPLQTTTVMDTCWVSKMQIPTNPRITSSLAFGMSKMDSSTANAATKPAYVSVSVSKPSNTSHGDAESLTKGTLPASLRTYVERTFARCKDDLQRAANQKLMMEVITKASADGMLFTRNWDIEPLFPLPISTSDEANQNVTSTTLPKFKRSPNRRMKSRWEPIADEKMAEKLASANYDLIKGAEQVVAYRKNVSNDNGWNGIKFVPSQQQTPLSNIAYRTGKKPRFTNNTLNDTATGDASSDSDRDQGLTKYYASAITLADSPEEKKRREHRVKRFEKAKVNQAEAKLYRPKISGAGNTYIRRESAMLLSKNSETSCIRAVEDIDWDALTVKGTCQEVEKRYLRLTSAPDPATVRPEEILEKALQMVQTSQKNYLYKCDQLKSIRQDLTVQRIQNALTVKVYETHARLSLEAGDLPEYNQCQSQLKRLYADGIQGCYMEFSAYNLLCVMLHSSNNRDLLSAMARLSIEAKEDGAVKHALAVRSAVSSGNYIRFFRLYKAAPNLNTCLMDLYAEKMRFNAVKNICKSYRPTLPVTYIAQHLGFLKEEITNGLDECIEWLKAHGALLTTDSSGEVQLDTKVSACGLYMPEAGGAVAHGDATLAVDDFLTRAASS